MNETEKLKNNTQSGKNGGARPGAGRLKGGQNKTTIEKKIIQEELRQKIMGSVNRLFAAQMNVAEGASFLYRIDKDSKGKKERPVLVTDPQEIQDYLSDEADTESYYYISTERPDNRAIDSMLNRVFGSPQQSMDVTTGGEKLDLLHIWKPERNK